MANVAGSSYYPMGASGSHAFGLPAPPSSDAESHRQYYIRRTREAYCRVKRELLRRQGDRHWSEWGLKPIAQYDGGRDFYARNHQPAWPTLADFLIANHCAPEPYLRAQVVGVFLPSPLALANAESLERYRDQQIEHRRLLAGRILSQVAEFSTLLAFEQEIAPQLPLIQQWRSVLFRRSTLTPLFRFCAAYGQPGLEEVATVYCNAAIEEFCEDPDGYADAWAELLPSGFAARFGGTNNVG